MPTRRGKILIAEGIMLYVLALGGAIDELYGLALAAIVFPLIGSFFVRFGRHQLRVTRTIGPRRLFAGGTVRFRYDVHNAGRLPSPPLILSDPAPRAIGGRIEVALPALPADRHGQITVERRLPARGRFAIGPMRARIEDPFGLAQVARDIGPQTSVVVFPRIEVLHEATPQDPRSGGGPTLLHRIATTGEEFYAIRDWQHGDDLRKIHWRSSARRGALQIRQDEIRPYPRATVLLDTRRDPQSAEGWADAFEWSISAAASVVWEAARLGFGVRLATAELLPGLPRWGREAADPLLTALAGTRPSGRASLHRALSAVAARAGAGGVLFALVPALDAEAAVGLARARASYDWAGAVLLDVASFEGVQGRARADYDQKLAETERTLMRAGWHVVAAGASDRFAPIWQKIVDGPRPRQSSPSLHL